MENEEIIIDLTLSDSDEFESDKDKKSIQLEVQQKSASLTPFDPPLNISGNILEARHYKILKSHSSWFTDDLINAFFCILQANNADRCFVFSSFFYDSLVRKGKEYCLKHWSKGIKTFLSGPIEDKIVLLPVNSGGSHWVLVAWSVEEGTLNYYDSLMCNRTGNIIMKRMTEFFNEMLNSESSEESDDIDELLSKLSINNTRVPFIKNNLIPKGQLQQTDGSSCGPFCCLNGKTLLDKTDKTPRVDIYEFRESLIEYFKENFVLN